MKREKNKQGGFSCFILQIYFLLSFSEYIYIVNKIMSGLIEFIKLSFYIISLLQNNLMHTSLFMFIFSCSYYSHCSYCYICSYSILRSLVYMQFQLEEKNPSYPATCQLQRTEKLQFIFFYYCVSTYDLKVMRN